MILEITRLKAPGTSLKEKMALQYRQLAVLLRVGISAPNAIDTLVDETDDKKIKQKLAALKFEISRKDAIRGQGNQGLSDYDGALLMLLKKNSHPEASSAFLDSIADELENSAALTRKLANSMTYPFFVLVIAILISLFIIIFVIPIFEEMYSGMGGSLPIPTQFTLSVAYLIKSNIIYLFAGLIIGIVVVKKANRFIVSTVSILPGIGSILKTISILQFIKTFSIMISIQMPVTEAARVAACVVENSFFSKKLKPIADVMRRETGLRNAMEKTGLFPKMVLQVAAVGEKTQTLDSIFAHVATYYEKQMDSMLVRFSSMIDVGFILAIGLFVGWLAIAMYLPIFHMAGVI